MKNYYYIKNKTEAFLKKDARLFKKHHHLLKKHHGLLPQTPLRFPHLSQSKGFL